MGIQPRRGADLGSTLLLATDRSSSVLAEAVSGRINRIAYSPYGNQQAGGAPQGRLGFNGELRDRPHGWYHLGNGHRVYNPVLRRFHSPDHLSPFAEGGLNPYAYCVGDPVNHVDPTGRDAQFLHIAALIGFGVALLAGGVSIFGPMVLKSAAAAPSMTAHAMFSATNVSVALTAGRAGGSALSSYAALQPGVGSTALGGLDAFSTFVSVMGVPIGAVGTVQSLQEDPSLVTNELMWAGAAMSLFAVPVKSLVVPLTPKLMASKWGRRVSKFVHGKAKVAAAEKDAVAAAMYKHFQEGVDFTHPVRSVTPPLPFSTPPTRNPYDPPLLPRDPPPLERLAMTGYRAPPSSPEAFRRGENIRNPRRGR